MTDYVAMLRQSLDKKVAVLEQIVIKNKEQAVILQDPNSDPDDFEKNVTQKGNLIEQINSLDDGFEALYNRVKETLDRDRAAYSSDIAIMQDTIRRITDLMVEIQMQEKENYRLADAKFSQIKGQVREIRQSQKAVSTYYQNMMKSTYFDPQFMDSKK